MMSEEIGLYVQNMLSIIDTIIHLKEEDGNSILECEISSLLDIKLVRCFVCKVALKEPLTTPRFNGILVYVHKPYTYGRHYVLLYPSLAIS